MIYLNIINSYRTIVATCDEELLGKYFEEGKLQLDIKENLDLRKEISKNGRKYAIENLTWENSAKKLHEQLKRWYS